MSLVNDALRRAKHAQKKSPPPPAISPAPRHVEPARPGDSSAAILWSLAIVALFGVVGGVLWFATRAGTAAPSAMITAQARSAPGPSSASPSGVRPTQPTPMPAVASALQSPSANTPDADASLRGRNREIADGFSALSRARLQPTASASAEVEPAPPGPVTVLASLAPTATVTQSVVVATGPPPPPPLPKLQGIVYRPERPTALLDGRTVLIGRTSGEYQVVAISERTVKVVRAGQTNILELPE